MRRFRHRLNIGLHRIIVARTQRPDIDHHVHFLRAVLPNFSHLNDMALASLLNMPAFDPAPFAIALVWLLGCFSLGYWIFKERDY